MSKIFSKNDGPDVNVKRNTFDLSYASHISTKMGQLTPIMCKEVLPGDSFEIDSAYGLRFAPLVFPVQTKIHATMHYFYVRNRNLYDKWMEYIGKTDPDAVAPYRRISAANAKSQLGTGSLADYLGVPTTIAGEYANVAVLPMNTTVEQTIESMGFNSDMTITTTNWQGSALALVNRITPYWYAAFAPNVFPPNDFPQNAEGYFDLAIRGKFKWEDLAYSSIDNASLSAHPYISWCIPCTKPMKHALNPDGKLVVVGATNTSASAGSKLNAYIILHTGDTLKDSQIVSYRRTSFSYDSTAKTWTANLNDVAPWFNAQADFNKNNYLIFAFNNTDNGTVGQSTPDVLPTDSSFVLFGDYAAFDILDTQVRDATDDDALVFNPFVGNDPKIRLNALPFRAYESIYNAFYRNETVDPLIINGKEVYNDFIRTHAGGADSLNYDLKYRNWESDYFTSCQTSPQQGIAPLVGVSANGTFTFKDVDNNTTYTAQATIGDDGETITGISTYDPSLPKGSLRQLMDTITNGISINDFRNVNSLQRWLETNIRKGYKYVDQIQSHFGVTPAYKANDMPEFLGGSHEVVNVNTISNTGDNLGDYAGQANCIGGNKHTIRKYCDEHGFIIGILCVFPEPVYSQMLPKMFLKTETPLDYFFPEFGHIGMQPITYNEVCPLQVAADDFDNSTDTINDVFGYQRAWADYLASNDEVHGDMRTSLSDYVISRTFQNKPQLGHNFIAISPDDVNDVFVNTGDDAKIFGQMRFDIKAKRPIPRFGVPRIE